jgi:L-2-hydroxyglutarate oxidase LhgO
MIVVVGAGVSGLASARALAKRGRAVCVLDGGARSGQGSSTHNSGVIHAGLYYPAGTLKARLCVEGRDRLYEFCAAHGVPHLRCGKLIVAPSHADPDRDDEAALEGVRRTAEAAGARVVPVDAAFVAAREPHVAAARGLWSPDTGWIDADAYVRALEAEVRQHEGVVLTSTPVIGIETAAGGGLVVVTPRERIDASCVVNAAGLQADEVSALAGGEPFRIYPCRGEYAELAPRARGLVRGLVYPVPDPSGHGLGVHLTRTIGGAVWIGPTIRYQDDKADYERDRLPIEAYLDPTRALLPEVVRDDLRLAGSGIRAKLHPPSERFADFLIRRDARNALLVHAAGIDSPGLTASLAIGEVVADVVDGREPSAGRGA